MATWKSVSALEDGQTVEAATFNKPLSELAGRTSYLKSMMEALGADGSISAVRFQASLSDTDTPEIGDVVCLDLDTKKFVKALASMSVFDVYTANQTSYAVGILVEKDTGTTGVVAASGYVNLSGTKFNIPSMLESGETFSNGVYYVSALEPGKITRTPRGPHVQVGMFLGNFQKSGDYTGDFAIVDPQYGDLLSHRHRTYSMSTKPVGTVVVSTADENDPSLPTCRVYGYAPNGIREGFDLPAGDFAPYLLLSGEWRSDSDISYEVWMSRGSGTSTDSSVAPSGDFSDVYLHWTSSDPDEGSGLSQVSGFYEFVPIGKMGLEVALDPLESNDLSSPYKVSDDDPVFRSWSIRMPYYAKGWTSNVSFDKEDFGGGKVGFFGVLSRGTGGINVYAPDSIFELPSTNPTVGSRMVIDGTTFQFVDASTSDDELDEGVVPVVVQGTAYQTFRGIAAPFSESQGYAIVFSSAKVYVGASSVSIGGTALSAVAVGGGTLSSSGGTCNLMVCDSDGASLSDSGYVSLTGLGIASPLTVGAKIYVTSDAELEVSGGTSAVLEGNEFGAGSPFRYNIEMDGDLNEAYPPVPAASGVLVWNGVEAESHEFFGDSSVYRLGFDSIYWNDDSYGRVPWPSSYKDPEEPVDHADRQRLLFHYVSSFHSDTGPVVSLHPAKGAPITIRRCGTTSPASVGDLELDVDLTVDVSDGSEGGYKAVKASKNGKLLLGPLVERIVAGPGISIEPVTGQPLGQGTVSISATNSSYSGEMDTIALENAKEEVIGMFPYIRLLGWDDDSESNIPTGFVAKFQIPTSISDGVYRVKMYATVFGEENLNGAASEQYAGVTMTYNILPDWTPISGRGLETASMNIKEDLIAPDASISADIPFGVLDENTGTYSYKAYDPVLIHNDPTIENMDGRSYEILGNPFPNEGSCSNYLASHVIGTSSFGVRPGYIVSVRFSRSAPQAGASYTGKIGFINLRWALVRAEKDETVEVPSQTDQDVSVILANLKRIASRYSPSNLRTLDQLRAALSVILDQLK